MQAGGGQWGTHLQAVPSTCTYSGSLTLFSCVVVLYACFPQTPLRKTTTW
jgi:hypothetical protein